MIKYILFLTNSLSYAKIDISLLKEDIKSVNNSIPISLIRFNSINKLKNTSSILFSLNKGLL